MSVFELKIGFLWVKVTGHTAWSLPVRKGAGSPLVDISFAPGSSGYFIHIRIFKQPILKIIHHPGLCSFADCIARNDTQCTKKR